MQTVLRCASAFLVVSSFLSAAGPKELKPGKNGFSIDQDIQLGRETAAQVEQQMSVVNDATLNQYVQRIGKRLTATSEAGEFPYSFKIINDDSINAFALPGGPTFVHTGLLKAVENEGQLAGVLAHEISHVALRHGTGQATRSNNIRLPAMILGGILGGSGSMLGQLAQLGVGLGANSILLSYSRGAESDADRLGARIMAKAGYNPLDMARFFEKLQAQGGSRGPQFLSDHPDPGNRVKIVEEEISYLPQTRFTDGDPGQLRAIQSRLTSLPAAPAKGRSNAPVEQGNPEPSGQFRTFNAGGLTISHPDNWEVFGKEGNSVTIAPRSGLVQDRTGAVAVGYGVMTSFFDANNSRDLRSATSELIGDLRRHNPALQSTGTARTARIGGRTALVTTLYNRSPLGGRETDMLVSMNTQDGLFYLIFIAPEQEFSRLQPTFEQMLKSVRIQ